MLPTQVVNGVSRTPKASSRSFGERVWRSERILLLLAVVSMCMLCFGAIYYVPSLDLAERPDDETNLNAGRVGPPPPWKDEPIPPNLLRQQQQLQQQQQEALQVKPPPPPPPPPHAVGFPGDEVKVRQEQHEQPHEVEQQQDQEAHPDERHQEEPIKAQEDSGKEIDLSGDIKGQEDDASSQQGRLPVASDAEIAAKNDPETEHRRQTVLGMMRHAWDGYERCGWGHSEIKPRSCAPHNTAIFGGKALGATIIDALDTLLIMGMKTEFNKAREWVEKHFDFTASINQGEVSVFETNIRFIGGLLAAHALTGDRMFVNKAVAVADALLPAFDTPTGIPYALMNTRTGRAKNYGWASGGCSILAEFGTLDLEWQYLSDVSGDEKYRQKVLKIREYIGKKGPPGDGLYPNYLHPTTGNWGQKHVSLGALGDSYYEYLLKTYLISGKTDTEIRQRYDSATSAIVSKLVHVKNSPDEFTYVSEMKGNRVDPKMDHLACFSGGMFALGAEGETRELHLKIGAGITETCHASYDMQPTKIGPESFRIANHKPSNVPGNSKYYILRPETFESYFILYRLTKDKKYRDWAWEAVQALEKHCKTTSGYEGLRDVTHDPPPKDDVQQSFFLAEALKYLYLIFTDDQLVIPLDDWVFNTEAHVLPVKTRRPHIRFLSSN